MTERELLLTCKKFSVERRTIRLPGGETLTKELVVHPGAVVILPLLADGKIVLIRNFRMAAGAELLELPAGTLEADEQPAACAARELLEETGYRAAELTPLGGWFYTSPGVLAERMHAFMATGLVAEHQHLDEGERITVAPHAPDEVRRMLVAGELRDGKTIAVLGQYFLSQSP
jgi:ADP-ribose pyrophosphatase